MTCGYRRGVDPPKCYADPNCPDEERPACDVDCRRIEDMQAQERDWAETIESLRRELTESRRALGKANEENEWLKSNLATARRLIETLEAKAKRR